MSKSRIILYAIGALVAAAVTPATAASTGASGAEAGRIVVAQEWESRDGQRRSRDMRGDDDDNGRRGFDRRRGDDDDRRGRRWDRDRRYGDGRGDWGRGSRFCRTRYEQVYDNFRGRIVMRPRTVCAMR